MRSSSAGRPPGRGTREYSRGYARCFLHQRLNGGDLPGGGTNGSRITRRVCPGFARSANYPIAARRCKPPPTSRRTQARPSYALSVPESGGGKKEQAAPSQNGAACGLWPDQTGMSVVRPNDPTGRAPDNRCPGMSDPGTPGSYAAGRQCWRRRPARTGRHPPPRAGPSRSCPGSRR